VLLSFSLVCFELKQCVTQIAKFLPDFSKEQAAYKEQRTQMLYGGQVLDSAQRSTQC